ncbi:uncharacterized protein ARMOST_15721 [Armillaria ostoyae]|uniref:Uncharacterized protein n=1 Tax=Armillaria ostoyae TaxID=47428 RepID=A0A284RU50_ARMOS|nr:uncharacterized protein ARMOST_15721 [Armillaria ostoyae]
MPGTRNPYNPNGVYPGDYPSRPSYNPNTGPPVFTPVNWNQPLANRPPDELISPNRRSRSRVRPEAAGSNYLASRAASQASRARPVTPPPRAMHFYDGPPETPPRTPTIPFQHTILPHKFPCSPGKGGVRIIPDQPVKVVAYVSHRGSIVPKDANGKVRPPKSFIFDHGRQVDPQVPCGDACAHFRFMRKENYKLNPEYKPLVVKQPTPIYNATGFIVFKDRRVDIDFKGKTARGSGVLLRDVLEPPKDFSVVDDDEVFDLSNVSKSPTILELNIDINGFPTSIANIRLACHHGRVTRFGILKAVAQLFYKTTHTKGPGNGESKHRNQMLPKRIKFENIRLISLYTHGGIWNAEYLYVAEKESKE